MTHEVRLRLIYIPPPASNLNVSYIERKRKSYPMSSGEDNRNSVCVRVSDQYPPGAMQCGGSQDGIHL